MTETVTIGERFNGPPHSGNGGYCSGIVAGLLGGPATARLSSPPPLETPLEVHRDGDKVRLLHGGALVAEAAPAAAPSFAPPCALTLPMAEAAEGYDAPEAHLFPTCYVCGPARAEGDGLRIVAGAVQDAEMGSDKRSNLVAAPWRPGPDLAAPDGLIAEEQIWAALDCPSYFSFQREDLKAVLGAMTAGIDRRPAPGQTCMVAAWPLRSEGRKHMAAAALLDQSGAVMARAETVWIELKPEAIAAMHAQK